MVSPALVPKAQPLSAHTLTKVALSQAKESVSQLLSILDEPCYNQNGQTESAEKLQNVILLQERMTDVADKGVQQSYKS